MREGITLHPARLAPMPAVTAILARFDRAMLEAAIEVMIGLLDATDGDAEAEDGELADGKIDAGGRYIGAAPPAAHDFDDGERVGDEADFAWGERVRQDRPGGREGFGEGFYGFAGNGEDAEVDDEAEGGGDDQDAAWAERGSGEQVVLFAGQHEDTERDDPAEANRQPAMTADAPGNDA